MKRATTNDVGLLIRDFIEARPFSVITTDKKGNSREIENADCIAWIDATDPSNLLAETRKGLRFTVRVIAGHRR